MFEHFEHKADIGIRGYGATMDEAFAEAAKAMTDVIVDVRSVGKDKKEVIEVIAADEGALLTTFLNQLLFIKDTKKLIFATFVVTILKKGDKLFLRAKVAGATLDPKRHNFKVDVKAATYSELKVAKQGARWVAQCIVDV
ncbi:MAG: archease [archaeon]